MFNARGVVYRPGNNMSDNEAEDGVDKKEGMASTPSHGLPPKDFQDVDPVQADSNGTGSTTSESNFETPTAEKKKTSKDGTSAKYTTPVTVTPQK